jgi:hypothetical protein
MWIENVAASDIHLMMNALGLLHDKNEKPNIDNWREFKKNYDE